LKSEQVAFNDMMDSIGFDVADRKGEVAVIFSGGIDCTACVCSLVNAGVSPLLIHMRHEPGVERWNEVFQEDIVYHMAEYLGLSVLFLPWVDHPVGEYNVGYEEFYSVFTGLNLGTLVSGDGMDRCYYECYDKEGVHHACTFGEDVRCNHPMIEMFLKTIPTRLSLYRKSTYEDRLSSDLVASTLHSISPKIFLFSDHPSFIDFFRSYTEDVRDIVFPKFLSICYVNTNLGISYYRLLRKVYRLNHLKYKRFSVRLLEHLIGGSYGRRVDN